MNSASDGLAILDDNRTDADFVSLYTQLINLARDNVSIENAEPETLTWREPSHWNVRNRTRDPNS